MDSQQLRVFVSAAQTLNFSKTANYFFLTQPAVSHQIKTLEEELQAVLFRRDGRNLRLTGEGLAFLDYAVELLNLEEKAKTHLQNLTAGAMGLLRLVSLPTMTAELSRCLTELSARYPKIQVEVEQVEGEDLMKAFAAGKHDFYFGVTQMLPSGGAYRYVVTAHTQLRLFVHKDVAPEIDMDNWDTIRSRPFVSVHPADTVLPGQIRDICMKRGFLPNILNYYNRAELVPLSVNAGVGIAILPAAVEFAYPHENIRTFPIDGEEAKIDHIIAWHASGNSAAAEKFEQIVHELYPDEK